MTKHKKYKVLVVDDSAVFRSLLTEILDSDPNLDVVGAAEDPYHARDLIKQLQPDVLTLDIEMPRMNGVQFLKNLMRLFPLPVVMISTLTQHGAAVTLEALELGAVDYFPKPDQRAVSELVAYRELVVEKVKMAAEANIHQGLTESTTPNSMSSRLAYRKDKPSYDLIAIGASTGGTEAIRSIFSVLPERLPPIVITQHINAAFSRPFAERLNSHSPIQVQELSVQSAPLIAGCAYVAPGDRHMMVVRRGGQLYGELEDGAPVNRHKPSVDILFSSIAHSVGPKALSILLTGMGSDGAQGLLDIKNQGGTTVAQDEKSSVVWGMPRVAVELGAANSVLPLKKVASFIVEQCYE